MRAGAIVLLLAAGLLPDSAVAASPSQPGQAICEFDLRGTAGDNSVTPVPVPPLTDQERLVTYTLRGPLTCHGGLATDQGPGRSAWLTASSSDLLPDPLSAGGSTNTCAAGIVNLGVTVRWPHSVMKGVLRFEWIAGDAVLHGNLGGYTVLGRGGIGGDPDKPYGNCTDQHPYTYWSLVGELVLADGARALQDVSGATPPAGSVDSHIPGSTDHNVPIVISGYQYLGGGTIDSFSTTDPTPSVTVPGPTVEQGETITFTNLDTFPHTVTSCHASSCDTGGLAITPVPPAPQLIGRRTSACFDLSCADGVFDSGTKLDQPGSSWTIQTRRLAPRTYYYFCEFHRFMRGSFSVVRASGPRETRTM